MHLMQQCPQISGDDYMLANHKYKERIFADHMWTRKFKQRMDTEINSELVEIKVE